MGNVCLRSKATQVAEEGREFPETKVESRDPPTSTPNVEIKTFDTENDRQWITKDLKPSSEIAVASSAVHNYWVWERTWDNGDPRWRFLVNPEEPLYITYDDQFTDLKMQRSGDNSYFSVNGGEKGGYIFQVPGQQKFIAENDGQLILSSTATEWLLIVDLEADRTEVVRRDILIVKEVLSSNKWCCESAAPGAEVTIDLDYNESKRSQWFRQYVPEQTAWHFQTRMNDNFFITCELSTAEIILQLGNNENLKQRLVKGHGEDSIKMLDDTETNYFYSQAEGTSTLLALTDEESRSTSWQFMLCGFEIDGKIIPPDLVQECPRKNSEEIKSDEQVVETQQQEQQQGSNE